MSADAVQCSNVVAQDTLVTILLLAANPIDTPQLRLDEDVRAIDAALHQSRYSDQFELQSHWAVRIDDLTQLLSRIRPQIVHFCGHGSQAGEIVLQNDDGNAVVVPTAALGELFRLFADSVRCVVLNACYSAHQAITIAEHVRCVVGTSGAITDAAARQFASAFYAALADGEHVQRSFELGCVRLALHGASGEKPVLLGSGNPKRTRFVRSQRVKDATQPSAPAHAGVISFNNATVTLTGDIVGRDKNIGIASNPESEEK